jgi:hypothetical protein
VVDEGVPVGERTGGAGALLFLDFYFKKRNCVKSRVVDPDPDSVTLWIRIRIGNPDPGSGSGSRGKKVKKFQWKNALFSILNKKFTAKKV